MPQFDQSSFLNQVFWLFFFLSNFYLVITFFFLPTLCKILKFRKKKVFQNQIDLNTLSLEHYSQNIIKVDIMKQNLLYWDETLKDVSGKTSNILTSIQTQLITNLNIQNYLPNFWIKMVSFPKYFKDNKNKLTEPVKPVKKTKKTKKKKNV